MAAISPPAEETSTENTLQPGAGSGSGIRRFGTRGGGGHLRHDAYGDEGKALTTDSEESSGPSGNKDPLNTFRYTGKRYDIGFDSLDMVARRFSPEVGRFMQRDRYLGALSTLGHGFLGPRKITGSKPSPGTSLCKSQGAVGWLE